MQEIGVQLLLNEYFQASIIVIIQKLTISIVLSCRTLSQIFGIGARIKSALGAKTFNNFQRDRGSSEKQESKRFLPQVGVSAEIREQGNAIDQTRRNRAVLIKVIFLSMFTYLFECICEEQPCVCEQEKCQVGEKYLSTGEE